MIHNPSFTSFTWRYGLRERFSRCTGESDLFPDLSPEKGKLQIHAVSEGILHVYSSSSMQMLSLEWYNTCLYSSNWLSFHRLLLPLVRLESTYLDKKTKVCIILCTAMLDKDIHILLEQDYMKCADPI